MSYKYDVFLSYKRRDIECKWIEELFRPFFIPYLEDALNRDVTIFQDSREIKAGTAWPEKLKNALAHSRCMVSIVSPTYFRSEWCMREFSIMYRRQEKLGYITPDRPNGLIIPVKLFDGEHFPDYTRKIQMLDCRDFNLVGESLKITKIYIDFQKVMQKWVYDIADVINNAPAWDPVWLTDEWSNVSDVGVRQEVKLKMSQPLL